MRVCVCVCVVFGRILSSPKCAQNMTCGSFVQRQLLSN